MHHIVTVTSEVQLTQRIFLPLCTPAAKEVRGLIIEHLHHFLAKQEVPMCRSSTQISPP